MQPDDDTSTPPGRPKRSPAEATAHGVPCPRCGGPRNFVIRVRDGDTTRTIHICHECDPVPGNVI